MKRLKYILPPLVAAVISSLVAARAEAAKVLLVRPTGASPALNETLSRLKGEVLSLGLELATVERPATPRTAPDARVWLERLAAEREADAVIDVRSDDVPGQIDIWVFAEGGRRSEIARIALDADAGDAPERPAIRAIDALRARLAEIELAAKARPARAQPATIAESPPPPPDALGHAVDLQAGAAMLTGVDGVGPALMPIVRIGWTARPWLELQAAVAGFGSRPAVVSASGSARVAQDSAVVGAGVCARAERTLQPCVALSGGVLRTAIDGQADAPADAHSVERWSFLLDAGAGARLNLPGRYHLTLAAHVQVAEPYIAIHVVDARVATSGRPNFLLSLTIGAWL